MQRLFHITLICLLFSLQACTAPVKDKSQARLITLADFPEDVYKTAAKDGEPVYAVDTEQSEVEIYVYKGGTFARMGHDHVVSSRDIHGYVMLPAESGKTQADIYVPLNTLIVDDPQKRLNAGFKSSLKEQDVDGTRRNMLDKVLEADRYPYVFIHVESEGDIYKHQMVNVELTLHGVSKQFTVPVEIEYSKDSLNVAGKLVLKQTDFGIEPYSVLGGALRVKDAVVLVFRLHTKKL
jgi:hypothetical protein